MVVQYLGVAVVAGMLVGTPAPAAQPHRIAYVRAGSIYVLSGATATRLTRDADDTRPRWSPDGRRIAYGHAGRLWVINADGTGAVPVATGQVGGADWSSDGRWLAFTAPGCTGTPGVFRVSATGGIPQALFPASCRGSAPPAAAPRHGASGSLPARLRADGSVAWSPDGTRIAFPGGDCLAVADDCLTVGDVASGTEQAVAVYGGGGEILSGFAVVPAWRPDGQRLSWTAAREGEAVHVVEADPPGTRARSVGVPLDREMVYDGTGRGVLTARYRGGSWIIAVDLATGARTPLVQGSQPSVER